MTSKTGILLIIQQSPGINYPSLLSKTAPNYANMNSARATLSRVLKDAISFGMVQKKENQLYLTDKGMASLKVKMHDKLLLKLNQLMRIRSVASNPGPLVQHLSVLLERGKMDPRLLDNARAGVNFSVTDLEKVRAQLSEHVQHLSYLEKTLDGQVDSLKQLNFPVQQLARASALKDYWPHFAALAGVDEVHIEHVRGLDALQTHPILQNVPATPRNNRVVLSTSAFHSVLNRLPEQEPTFQGILAHAGLFTLELGHEWVTVKGPSQWVNKLDWNALQAHAVPLLASPAPAPPMKMDDEDEGGDEGDDGDEGGGGEMPDDEPDLSPDYPEGPSPVDPNDGPPPDDGEDEDGDEDEEPPPELEPDDPSDDERGRNPPPGVA